MASARRVSRYRPGDREEAQERTAAPYSFQPGYSTIFAGNSGGQLEHGAVFHIPSMKCVNFWNFIGTVKGFGETAFATESASSKSGKAPVLEIFSQAVYQSASHHAATVLNGQISAKYRSCKSISFSDTKGGTIRETVHARKAERVGGHPSLLLTEYLTDTKVKGVRVVTKALWTIVGTNVYMIDSQPAERHVAQAHAVLAHAQADRTGQGAQVGAAAEINPGPAVPAGPSSSS